MRIVEVIFGVLVTISELCRVDSKVTAFLAGYRILLRPRSSRSH